MAAGGGFTRGRYPMPTYEYVCTKCGHEMEAFQSMKDAALTKCPACRKAGLKRKVGGGAGLIFKGSGFYITDYKKKSGNSGEKPATPAKSPETKPAATPAAK
jgi:putative FmdB family regulatory protein